MARDESQMQVMREQSAFIKQQREAREARLRERTKALFADGLRVVEIARSTGASERAVRRLLGEMGLMPAVKS